MKQSGIQRGVVRSEIARVTLYVNHSGTEDDFYLWPEGEGKDRTEIADR